MKPSFPDWPLLAPDMVEADDKRQFVTALARGLELLRCFTPDGKALGNQELACRSGLPRPTVSRLTHTLTRLGYLRYTPASGKYHLEIGVLAFGYAMLGNLAICDAAHAPMAALARQAQAAVAIGARDRLDMVYLHVAHSEAHLTMRRQVGSRIPLHSSAMGRLAWRPCRKPNAPFCWNTSAAAAPTIGPPSGCRWNRHSAITPNAVSACLWASGSAASTQSASRCAIPATA